MSPHLLHPCAAPGCPALLPLGVVRCEAHRREVEARAGTAASRGYGARWREYSRRRLAELPYCARCGRLGDVTDHILPARVAPERFWDPTNHQTLCFDCNKRKGIEEEGGFGRAPRR